MDTFEQDNRRRIAQMGQDQPLQDATRTWFQAASKQEYSYHFTWMGRPIIQFPQDIVAMQELVWKVQPDLIVETGIARGGSLIFYASMLELLGGNGHVLGLDIDIRPHNRAEIEKHPMFNRITMIQGSSIDEGVAAQVFDFAARYQRVMLVLDSNHTHDHVLRELQLYSPLVKAGSYAVVFDTVIEDMPREFVKDRPWSVGNNPMTAVKEFLKTSGRFEIDVEIQNKLLITVAPNGYLKCIKD